MRTANKLGLLLALALAALAFAAASSAAVTVSPPGTFAAHSTNANLVSNDTSITITCASTAAGTINSNGTGTLTSLTFHDTDCAGLCTADTAVTGLPVTFMISTTETVNTADNDATVTVTANAVAQVITCGALIGDCGFSPPGDVQLNFTEGDQTITATDVRLNRTSGNVLACGTDATWNATYTLTDPPGGLSLDPN